MTSAWKPPPWYAKPVGRIVFLRELSALDSARVVKVKDNPAGFSVALTLQPLGVDAREVQVSFRGHIPFVTVDGPSESPHRFSDGSLCMWYPHDPRDKRWMPADGAAALVANIAAHLVKEAWWRRTQEWLGEEVRHDGFQEDLRKI